MEHYLVSARKYRPSTFASVVGQKALTGTLKNAIATGRLAHSYLFTGSRGVGKTSCARIFAKTINCAHPGPDGEACNECDSCRAFNAGNSMNIIELDAASRNSVDDMRALIEQVAVPPSTGRYRVFIIDEVHMLSSAAFNAFLKTLEEPPSYVVFILATTEKHKIIPTILSRCQIYDFATISVDDIAAHLAWVAKEEGAEADEAALGVIARKADGAMRDALSIFDQVVAATEGHVTYEATLENLNELNAAVYAELMATLTTGRVGDAWLIYKQVRDRGFDSHFFLQGLGQHVRDLMVASDPATLPLLNADSRTADTLRAEAGSCTPAFLLRAMDIIGDADLNYRVASNKQFLIELTLARIAQLMHPLEIAAPDRPGRAPIQPIGAARASAPAAATASPVAKAPAANHSQFSATPSPSQSPSQAAAPAAPKAAAPAQRPAAVRPAPARAGSHGPSLKRPGATAAAPAANPSPFSATPSPSQAPSQYPAGTYTEEQMREAWLAWALENTSRQLLSNTMRASIPANRNGDEWTVTVATQVQADELAGAAPEIIPFLRSRLACNAVTFRPAVVEDAAGPQSWSEKELLQKMIDDNPAVGHAVKMFGLTFE